MTVQLGSKQLITIALSATLVVTMPSTALADTAPVQPATSAAAAEPWNDLSLSYAERRRAAMEAGVYVHSGQVSLAALERTDSMQGLRTDPATLPPTPAPTPQPVTPPAGLQIGTPPFAAAGLLGGIGLAFTALMAMLPRPKVEWQ